MADDWRAEANRCRRTVRWPAGEAVCMTVGVALEAFDRRSQVALVDRSDAVDTFSLSYGEYGVRVGVWRLLELFDELDVRASFSTSGRLADEWPDVVAAVAAAGHEVVGHGWVNDAYLTEADEQSERATIRSTLDAIERACGTRPVGWASPANSSSEQTWSVLASEGVVWCGDDASDDLPFVRQLSAGELAILPKVNLAANDLLHWVWPHNPPSVFRESFVDTFDTLHAEGQAGRPQWADIVLHCHMAGRPTFIPTIREVVGHVHRHADTWWATKGELARWTLDQGWLR